MSLKAPTTGLAAPSGNSDSGRGTNEKKKNEGKRTRKLTPKHRRTEMPPVGVIDMNRSCHAKAWVIPEQQKRFLPAQPSLSPSTVTLSHTRYHSA